MLTLAEYGHLWQAHFFGIVPAGVIMPDYCEYLDREHMVEDYLDIFRGINTRASRAIQPCHGWYYPHPFFDKKGKGKIEKPCIKYIMIGEAAPSSAIPHFDINGNDLENSYFYNVTHQENTQYFTAPCNAFGVVGATKNDKLLHLASKGVILLDLFPFAYSYSGTIRTALNNNNVTFDFWHNLNNNYSVASRLRHLPVAQNCKGALIAPPIISHHIAAGLNFGLNGGHAVAPVGPPYTNLGLVFRMGVNTFLPHHFHFNNHFFNGIPPGTNLIPWYAAIPAYPLFGITSVPIYCSCCYSGAGIVPHELFIRNAFGV